jgi:adenylate cyclase
VEDAKANGPVRRLRAGLFALGRRYPAPVIVAITLLSNLTATAFNITYNGRFVARCNETQQEAFWRLVGLYNPIAFPVGLGTILALAWPIQRNHRRVLRGEALAPDEMRRCQKTLVNLPFLLACVNSLCWVPGAFLFPAVLGPLGDPERVGEVWQQFMLSFGVGMGLTVVQTLFFVEEFVILVLYPLYFRDARPADTPGGLQIGFFWRLFLFWGAVALMPMIAVVVLTGNIHDPSLQGDFYLTVGGGLLSGGLISLLVGRSLWRWLREQGRASERITHGDLSTRVEEKRPDEWGKLTDRFNDMAAALQHAELARETLGQFVGPEARDEILAHYPGLEVSVQEITVLFADIRGFTARSAGQPPERVGALLNRFLTLALWSIEDRGGYVNKFLGDGVMALFGATRPRPDHADLALACAHDLLARLGDLNAELCSRGEAPLRVGIGIHTGPALVGCFGATVKTRDGGQRVRREFTAIGETVNLCQRIEQLTKQCGGPILVSEATRQRLRLPAALECVGPQDVPGAPEPVVVHRAAKL